MPPALAVGHHRQGQGLGAAPGRVLGPVGPDVGAQDQHRPLGGADEPGHGGDRVRVGLAGGRRAGLGQLGGGLGEHRLQGQVEEHRPPVRLGGQPQRPVDLAGDVGGLADGGGPLGDGRRPAAGGRAPGGCPCPTARSGPGPQDHHRRPVEVGGGDRADPVGHPGPGREDGQPRPPQQLGRGLGREHRRLLVADVDQPQRRVGLDRPVVQREHVPAGEGEQLLDPVAAGHGDSQRPAMPLQPGPLSHAHLPATPAARCYPAAPERAQLAEPADWAPRGRLWHPAARDPADRPPGRRARRTPGRRRPRLHHAAGRHARGPRAGTGAAAGGVDPVAAVAGAGQAEPWAAGRRGRAAGGRHPLRHRRPGHRDQPQPGLAPARHRPAGRAAAAGRRRARRRPSGRPPPGDRRPEPAQRRPVRARARGRRPPLPTRTASTPTSTTRAATAWSGPRPGSPRSTGAWPRIW